MGRWTTGRCTQMAETGGRIALADNSMAAYTIRYGDLLEEQETFTTSGKIQVALSYHMGVVKGDPDCFESLDVTA